MSNLISRCMESVFLSFTHPSSDASRYTRTSASTDPFTANNCGMTSAHAFPDPMEVSKLAICPRTRRIRFCIAFILPQYTP